MISLHKYKKLMLVPLLACVLFGAGAFTKEFVIGTTYNVYLKDVDNTPEVQKLLTILREAKPSDTVNVRIVSKGGGVLLMLEIYNAVKLSRAKVYTINEGYAFSAGAVVALAGDISKNGESCSFMLHLARTFKLLPTGEVETVILPLGNPANRMVLDLVKQDFPEALTPEEYYRMLRGDDIVITCKEMSRRMGKQCKGRI